MLFASFSTVFLKAWQQQNVISGNLRAIATTSLFMGLSEVTVIIMVAVERSWWLAIPMGLGGACGACLAVTLHERKFDDKEEN